ncbi:tetratricopeptide repeat protein [Algibacter sp. L3A6]|uniref:tetratricopeptide repeat protein n=1 Tax=Algibacter sp. L3A6 TaxID=2686366 RepID=UPI00131ED0CB|nr:tetratricopeptide repeat protein [Algibacter sp. L3A6]
MNKFLIFLLLPIMVFSQSSIADFKELVSKKHYQKAEPLLIQYLENTPNDLQAIELLGDVYGHQKQWDHAIDNYKKLVESKPKTANYHYKYGGALGMKALSVSKFTALGLIGDIKGAFLKAAELDATHIDTRWALVELYMQLPGVLGGSRSKSLQYAEELEVLSKVDGYLAKGYIYEYDDEPKLAEKFYKMAIAEGGSLNCFDKLTAFYENEKRPEEAIKNIEQAEANHKRNALHYQIGKVAAEYNVELEKGEACLNQYIQHYSAKDGVPKAWAYYRLAQIETHQKNKEKALKYIDLAIVELPKIKVFQKQKEAVLKL